MIWLELTEPLESRAIFERALAIRICFAPGDVFSASDRYANCLRLSCGHSWHPRIERALKTLGGLANAALGAYKAPKGLTFGALVVLCSRGWSQSRS